MCGEFGEVSGIIDLVINFLAGGTLFWNSYDTLSYIYQNIPQFTLIYLILLQVNLNVHQFTSN